MKFKYHFFIYIAFIHLLILGLLFYEFREQKLWIIGLEAVILLSLLWAYYLYNLLVRPVGLMNNAIQSIKDQDFSCKFRKTGYTEMDQLVEVYNRMIDMLRDERQIQQEKHFFLENLITALPVGIILIDYTNNIKRVNHAALVMIGKNIDEIAGLPPDSIDSPLCRAMAGMDVNESVTIQLSGIEKYKAIKGYFIDQGFRNYFFIIQEMTQEIVDIEKNAYGKVIRMMSHEVNNSIGAINSLLGSILSLNYPMKQEEYKEAEGILRTIILRNDNLNYFMKNFADIIRLPKPSAEQYDLNRLVQGVISLVHSLADKNHAEIKFTPLSGPYMIHLDVRQIEQLLINIIKNSIEAGAEKIMVCIRPESSVLVVTDDGKGLTPEEERQLFTPFFTTKKEGQGIGLTLAREIAMNHHYSCSLRNNPPKGTVFKLTMRQQSWKELNPFQ